MNEVQRLPAMAGRFEISGDAVLFRPRFPFLTDCGYALMAGKEIAFIDPMPPKAGTAQVLGIYPTAPELPQNNLKIYVEFSRPMSEGWAWRAVRILDNDGTALEGAVLSTPELWDREHRRLTILFEPGRIKRGLTPNREAGPPLIEARPVVIVVDSSFADARGRPLRSGSRRPYRIGPAIRTIVDPALWRHKSPAAGSRDALTVRFDRPLDRGLLGHCLRVVDADCDTLAGRPSIGRGERSWRFVPAIPWTTGCYAIEIDHRLEDLAGNSLVRVFDRDLTQEKDAPKVTAPDRIYFWVLPRQHPATGRPRLIHFDRAPIERVPS